MPTWTRMCHCLKSWLNFGIRKCAKVFPLHEAVRMWRKKPRTKPQLPITCILLKHNHLGGRLTDHKIETPERRCGVLFSKIVPNQLLKIKFIFTCIYLSKTFETQYLCMGWQFFCPADIDTMFKFKFKFKISLLSHITITCIHGVHNGW